MKLLLLILMIGIVFAIFWYVKKTNQHNEETPTITYSGEYKKPEPEKKGGGTKSGGTRVTYGPGMQPGRPLEAEHTITKIYSSGKREMIWICPNCEVENSLEDKVCCVCRKVV